MKYRSIQAAVAVLILAFGNFARAQYGPGYLSVSAGYSLPVGKFAKPKPDDPLSGLAGSGAYAQINFDRQVWNWVGFRISANVNSNNTNSGPIIDKANSYTIGTGKTYGWQSNVSKWKLGALLAGPAAYLRFRKFVLEAHIQAGVVTARTPSVNLTGNALLAGGQPDPASRQIDIAMDQKTVTPFAFAGGASIRYPLYKSMYVNVNADIVGARATVKDLAIRARIGTLELKESLSDKRFIGVANLGAGLGVAF